ncbi:MAG TPA: DUF4259 domain-containing protein [Corynebacterium sp.]|nr:DUF4259 domain-containing protein [Corynebacterium sp.]
MGTWNVGPFDNDSAQDLLNDIRAHRFDFDQFRFDCAGDEVIDAEDAAVIIALSALVQACSSGGLPPGITRSDLRQLDNKPARRWLSRKYECILDEASSPIYAIWEATGELDLWLTSTKSVRP